jgi:hypothetical protein
MCRLVMVCALGVCGWATSAMAGAPLKLEALGSPAVWIAEATEKADELSKQLETAESYQEAVESVKQSASLVALIGQTLAEHPEESALKAAGPSIRDAAIKVARAGSFDDAKAGFGLLQSALKGEVNAEAKVEYDWAKITKMHPIMEEMNARAAKFRRVIRRPKDPEVDSRHVAAIALAAVSSHADTHEVKNAADLPQWHAWATELYDHMSASATAVRAKDMEKAKEHFNAGMETCTKCHDKFQD